MRKLTASLFLLTACLTACSPTVSQATYGSLSESAKSALPSVASECFAEAMAYLPASGECVPSSFWADTPGLILPQ